MPDAGSSTPPIPNTPEVIALRFQQYDERLRDGAQTLANLRAEDARIENGLHNELDLRMEKMQSMITVAIAGVEAKVAPVVQALEKKIEGISPKPISKMTVVLSSFGIVVFALSVVWAASRYPERAEFETFKAVTTEISKTTEKRLDAIEVAQAFVARDVGDIRKALERQAVIEQKLDALLIQGSTRPTTGPP